jgi:NADH-quinone oxidoreductase subunit M
MLVLRSSAGEAPSTLIWLPERFGLFGSLAVGRLNLYFLLLTHGLLTLTLLSFRQGFLEERSTLPLSAAAAEQRRRAFTAFGVLMAFIGFALTVYFCSENLALFFISFEASALPIFAVILFYGKRSPKFRAAAYLLYFTLLSGAPLLLLLLLLYQRGGTLFYPELLALQHQGLLLKPGTETLLAFLAFFLPFGVKFSFFPLHSWLPEAHVEASTEGSMLLSGILLKLGFYGVVKCCLPLCGGALFGVAPALLSLALVGSLAGSLATYRQLDLKKIIAYSSVVHMNLSLVGYLSLSVVALQGALFLNFSHAAVSAGLFSAVGLLQDRTRTRNLPELSGLQTVMPL